MKLQPASRKEISRIAASTLICSGILDVRLEEVLDALKTAGLTVTAVKEKEDWRSVTARKE